MIVAFLNGLIVLNVDNKHSDQTGHFSKSDLSRCCLHGSITNLVVHALAEIIFYRRVKV